MDWLNAYFWAHILNQELCWWLRWSKIRLQCGRFGFEPWVGKIPWRRAWKPPPVFFPGESHGQRSLGGYSPWGRKVRHNWATLQSTFWIRKSMQTQNFFSIFLKAKKCIARFKVIPQMRYWRKRFLDSKCTYVTDDLMAIEICVWIYLLLVWGHSF